MKRPSFQLYPGDWLRDHVSGCSLAAQGLWLRLMLVMHDSEVYGQTSLPKEQLARRCGCTHREFQKLFGELQAAGVPTVLDNGAIVSRRMVKDEIEREKTAARQRKFYEEHNAKPNGQSNADLTLVSHPSSSSSSVQTNKQTAWPTLEQVLAIAAQIGCQKEEAEKFWNHFESSGWIDKNGHAVAKWQNKLATWAANNRAADFQMAAKRKQNASPDSPGKYVSRAKHLPLDTRTDEQIARDREVIAKSKAELAAKLSSNGAPATGVFGRD